MPPAVAPSDDRPRCNKRDGKNWRCAKSPVEGFKYCLKHRRKPKGKREADYQPKQSQNKKAKADALPIHPQMHGRAKAQTPPISQSGRGSRKPPEIDEEKGRRASTNADPGGSEDSQIPKRAATVVGNPPAKDLGKSREHTKELKEPDPPGVGKSTTKPSVADEVRRASGIINSKAGDDGQRSTKLFKSITGDDVRRPTNILKSKTGDELWRLSSTTKSWIDDYVQRSSGIIKPKTGNQVQKATSFVKAKMALAEGDLQRPIDVMKSKTGVAKEAEHNLQVLVQTKTKEPQPTLGKSTEIGELNSKSTTLSSKTQKVGQNMQRSMENSEQLETARASKLKKRQYEKPARTNEQGKEIAQSDVTKKTKGPAKDLDDSSGRPHKRLAGIAQWSDDELPNPLARANEQGKGVQTNETQKRRGSAELLGKSSSRSPKLSHATVSGWSKDELPTLGKITKIGELNRKSTTLSNKTQKVGQSMQRSMENSEQLETARASKLKKRQYEEPARTIEQGKETAQSDGSKKTKGPAEDLDNSSGKPPRQLAEIAQWSDDELPNPLARTNEQGKGVVQTNETQKMGGPAELLSKSSSRSPKLSHATVSVRSDDELPTLGKITKIGELNRKSTTLSKKTQKVGQNMQRSMENSERLETARSSKLNKRQYEEPARTFEQGIETAQSDGSKKTKRPAEDLDNSSGKPPRQLAEIAQWSDDELPNPLARTNEQGKGVVQTNETQKMRGPAELLGKISRRSPKLSHATLSVRSDDELPTTPGKNYTELRDATGSGNPVRDDDCDLGTPETPGRGFLEDEVVEPTIARIEPRVAQKQMEIKCHHCRNVFRPEIIGCGKCRQKWFCTACIYRWYAEMDTEDFVAACAYCREKCNCNTCMWVELPMHSNTVEHRRKIQLLQYMLIFIQPCLRMLFEEQHEELELNANMEDVKLPKEASLDKEERLFCNNCKTSIFNLHRNCPSCGYDLCLKCCRAVRCCHKSEVRNRVAPVRMKNINIGSHDESLQAASSWVANADESVPCPPSELGGCGHNRLVLKRLLKPKCIERLLTDIDHILTNSKKLPELSDQSHCSICSGRRCHSSNEINTCARQAAFRHASNDNYIYCPTVQMVKEEGLSHFQWHWRKGEPIVVRGVFTPSRWSCWKPNNLCQTIQESMRQAILDRKGSTEKLKVLDCLDRQEVEISISSFFEGYQQGRRHKDGWPQMLKLKDWPPFEDLESKLPELWNDFISCLPIPEYTHPKSGVMNLVSKVPADVKKPDLGPKFYIAYGMKEEIGWGDSVTNLHCDMADAVNVLVDARECKLDADQANKIARFQELYKTLCASQKDPVDQDVHSIGARAYEMVHQEDGSVGPASRGDHTYSTTTNSLRAKNMEIGAALWDIYRREDVPKLRQYLQTHVHEFPGFGGKNLEAVIDPIHDQYIYLNKEHKRKLKDEFGVEAWTFHQSVGEAVLVPAGCPHQVRNLKSCTKVALDFVSPESLRQCIGLTEEFRSLPREHFSSEDKLEVKKMIICAVREVVSELKGYLQPTEIGVTDHYDTLTTLMLENSDTRYYVLLCSWKSAIYAIYSHFLLMNKHMLQLEITDICNILLKNKHIVFWFNAKFPDL